MKHLCYFTLFLTGVLVVFLLNSCNMCSNPQNAENVVVDTKIAEPDMESIYMRIGEKVLLALPTPIEATMLIKNWGVPSPEILNDPENAAGYLTTTKQAINLGVYITDMTTAGIYQQTQTVLRYKQALHILSEALGLQSIINSSAIQQLEESIDNREEMLQIIANIYSFCTEFLSEDDRNFYALAMLSGGWVEGMYISLHMIDENNPANEEKMQQVILENKVTFDILWEALGNIKTIPNDAVLIMHDMSYIANLFGHQSPLLASTPMDDPDNNINNITPIFFSLVKEHIHLLRQHFIKK